MLLMLKDNLVFQSGDYKNEVFYYLCSQNK